MISIEKINKRIQSIKTSGKIIFAMMMLAKVKLQKIKNTNKEQTNFFNTIFKTYYKDINSNPYHYFKQSPTPINIYIIFGSDLGLCGPFNNNIIKHLNTLIKPSDKLIIFGQKLYNLIKYTPINTQIIQHFTNLEINDHLLAFKDLSYECTQSFKNSPLTSITIINFNISKNSQTPTTTNIFQFPTTKPLTPITSLTPSWKNYLSYCLQYSYWSSKLAEYTNRLNSMTTANDNAEELLHNYKIQYNKIRQNNITQGILEIINASKFKE